jgi:hypothetical protein
MEDQTASHSDDATVAKRDLAELRSELSAACQATPDWPGKVAAAVYAGIDFAAADPERALSLLARDADSSSFNLTVEWLDVLLRRTAPVEDRQVIGAVRAIAMIVSDHLRGDRSEQLRSIGPALVQFALQPFLGYAEAKRWASHEPPGRDMCI